MRWQSLARCASDGWRRTLSTIGRSHSPAFYRWTTQSKLQQREQREAHHHRNHRDHHRKRNKLRDRDRERAEARVAALLYNKLNGVHAQDDDGTGSSSSAGPASATRFIPLTWQLGDRSPPCALIPNGKNVAPNILNITKTISYSLYHVPPYSLSFYFYYYYNRFTPDRWLGDTPAHPYRSHADYWISKLIIVERALSCI